MSKSSQASSSIGRAAVSKTAGWGFDSLLACHLLNMNDEAKQTNERCRQPPTPRNWSPPSSLVLGRHRGVLRASEPPGSLGELGRRCSAASCSACCVFAFSQYGRSFWQFVLESRVELRKVVLADARRKPCRPRWSCWCSWSIASMFFWLLDLVLASATQVLHRAQGS